MGERGPQPKYSAEARALQGNPGNRQLPVAPEDETPVTFPDVLDDVPAAPEWLHGEESEHNAGTLAVEAWNAIAPVLVNARQFREGDQIALARYCRYVAEWIGLTNDIDRNGFTITNTSKFGETTTANPSIRSRSTVETGMSALEKELGLSPRARVEVQKRLMAAARNLPIIGDQTKPARNGPIGALNDDDEEDDE